MSVVDRPFNSGQNAQPIIKLSSCGTGILPVNKNSLKCQLPLNLIKRYLNTEYALGAGDANASQGFTLIELLVVIMIIGILSAIALPAFLNQVNKAKEVEAIQATKYLSDRQSERFHQELNFTDNLNQLNFYLPTETENYCYQVLADNNALNGSVHVALSKKPGLKSYASVVYYRNEQMLKCQPVPIQVSCPASSLQVAVLIANVVANPKKYCP